VQINVAFSGYARLASKFFSGFFPDGPSCFLLLLQMPEK
jgi:hypothetical protein